MGENEHKASRLLVCSSLSARQRGILPCCLSPVATVALTGRRIRIEGRLQSADSLEMTNQIQTAKAQGFSLSSTTNLEAAQS